ncbi:MULTISPECIES: hypothetical protein [Pseudoalteromonas]|uniref:hypothetical protein n=1 Tax=Pseudoalteromonas TaxID=53246 RepID=UPI0019D0D0C8|nr:MULTISPECIES: hypothetical protein [Pseudoalteromonas]MBR8843870.1 hypothetical protein [Pseudoalteromonas sp. JC3]UDM60729.1 hypothetical protein KIJ96_13000 [Pseudoalteromonas piscicida]WJE08131.1 hypothetical protein QSH61_14735 [Pseudoalteromonas sp. JC3]
MQNNNQPKTSLFKYVASVKLPINCVAFSAVTFVVVYEFWLSKLPELFWWGAEVSLICSQICLSIIASYVFYLFVVHKKELDDWQAIKPSITAPISTILKSHQMQLQHFKDHTDTELNQYPTKDELEVSLSKICPRDKTAPVFLARMNCNANWYQYLELRLRENDELLAQLFRLSHFMDGELIFILQKLHSLTLKKAVYEQANMIENPNMGWLSGQFYQYSDVCRQLSEYKRNCLE